MALVANTKGASELPFAEDEAKPLFLPKDTTSWRICKGNSGNRDPQEMRLEAVDWTISHWVFNPTWGEWPKALTAE